MTIKLRLIICVVLLTGISLALVAGYITRHNTAEARRTGFAYAGEVAARNAAEVQQTLMTAMNTARDLTEAMAAESSSGGNRATANAELEAILSGHPAYLGVWTAWEPNAFDGRDRRYRSADARHDATGRFVPYWFRDGATITSAVLTDYTKQGAGDYYLIAQTTGKEKVLEPYSYEVGGKAVLMTSMAAPIIEGGRTVGVAGVDLPLETVGAAVAAITPFGTGSAMLVSSNGLLAGGGDSAQAGKAADAGVAQLGAKAAGSAAAAQRVISGDGAEQVQIAVPVARSAPRKPGR